MGTLNRSPFQQLTRKLSAQLSECFSAQVIEQFRVEKKKIIIPMAAFVAFCFSLASPMAAVAQAPQPGYAQEQAQPIRGLPMDYFSTNRAAGSPARYGFLLPRRPRVGGFQLVFAAELDVDAYKRRMKLCYQVDQLGNQPRHTQCVESIPTQITAKINPDKDVITVLPLEEPDSERPQAFWVDLINPIEPGNYSVELWSNADPNGEAGASPLGRWQVRIEYPSYDGAASDS